MRTRVERRKKCPQSQKLSGSPCDGWTVSSDEPGASTMSPDLLCTLPSLAGAESESLELESESSWSPPPAHPQPAGRLGPVPCFPRLWCPRSPLWPSSLPLVWPSHLSCGISAGGKAEWCQSSECALFSMERCGMEWSVSSRCFANPRFTSAHQGNAECSGLWLYVVRGVLGNVGLGDS